MRAPGLILGRSVRATSGGTMLETLMRLMLPMPAARSALSKALRGVPPSAWPAVAAAIVIVFLICLLLLDLQSRVHRSASDFPPSLYWADERMQGKSWRQGAFFSCIRKNRTIQWA